jgi:predicted PurR-regulated permease PerM
MSALFRLVSAFAAPEPRELTLDFRPPVTSQAPLSSYFATTRAVIGRANREARLLLHFVAARMRETRIQIGVKTILLVLLSIGGAWVLLRLLPVVLVLVGALFLAGTLGPLVEWLRRRGVNRTLGIVAVFLCVLGAVAGVAVLTLPPLFVQAEALAKMEPELRSRVADFLARSRFTYSFAESIRHLKYESLAHAYAETALAYSTRAVVLVAYFLSSVFLALYIMIDRDRLRAGIFSLVPWRHHVRMSRAILGLETIVGGYIRGQVLTSLFMTGFSVILLTILGAPNALAIAVFAGVADILPYIGPFLSVTPIVLAVSAKGLGACIVALVAMVIYEEFESRFIIPRVYGKALRLPPSMVLLALLIGGTLMGIVGALLALPAAAAIRMLLTELRVDLPGVAVDRTERRARDALAEQEYLERARGLPPETASEIAVRIAEEQGPTSMR